MTITEFQKALRDDLVVLFNDVCEKWPDGTKGKINGYLQDLPKDSVDEDEEEDDRSRFPYFIVRILGGKDEELDSIRGSVQILILFGVYDNDPKNNGHEIILRLIQTFRERYELEPRTAGYGYRMKPKIEWVLQDEPTYPYFFGGIETEWDILLARKEDPYS